jgi:hypothetical protein
MHEGVKRYHDPHWGLRRETKTWHAYIFKCDPCRNRPVLVLRELVFADLRSSGFDGLDSDGFGFSQLATELLEGFMGAKQFLARAPGSRRGHTVRMARPAASASSP